MSHLTRAIRFVRHWHARAGVMLALLFIFLALSGLALNHTDALGLAKHQINTNWLMRWYGFKPLVPTRGYLFDNGYLATADGRWVMDGRVLSDANQVPIGAVTWGEMRAIANADTLFLYLPNGQLVDKLSGSALPNKTIKQLGKLKLAGKQQLVLKTIEGNYITDDGLSWQSKASTQVVWSVEQSLPKSAVNTLNQAFAPSLPLERIILDLHSGRIFGRYGPLLMDITAIGLVILSLSGLWIYLRTVRRRSHH